MVRLSVVPFSTPKNKIMAENWQIVLERANGSNGIWQTFNPGFLVGELTLALHEADAVALPTRQAEKVAQESMTDASRDTRDANYALIKDLAVRVPRALEATLPAANPLIDDIERIRTMELNGMKTIQLRGTDVKTLWNKGNTYRATLTPAQGPLLVGGKTVGDLTAALNAIQGLDDAISNQEGQLSERRSILRNLTMRVDRNNKRWYLAWVAEYLPGTPEHDALSLIDTGSPGGEPAPGEPPLPTAPGGATLGSVTVDDTAAITVAGMAAPGATSFDVQLLAPGETEFSDHTTAPGPMVTFGPLAAGSWQVRIAGRNAQGLGPWSEPGTFEAP